VDPDEEDAVAFRVFNFDPTFAPRARPPCRLPLALLTDVQARVRGASCAEKDATRYEAEKERVRRRGHRGVRAPLREGEGRIQVVDVATPATIVRYTAMGQPWSCALHAGHVGIKPLPVSPGARNLLHGRPVDLAAAGIAR